METRMKEIFFKRFSMQELLFPRLFQRKTSTKSHEDRMRVAGLGTFQLKAEGTPVAFDDGVQGARVRTVHQTFALGTRATWEALEDDQFDIIDKMPEDLGDSARDHMERLAWALINDAYAAGGVYTGLESENLFASDHTGLKSGATNLSNILSPPVALSVTGLESALTAMRTTTSDEGRFIEVNRKRLLFHPNLMHTAYVVLQTEYRPGTSDNDKSTVASSRSGITPVVDDGVPYITNQNAWSLHGPAGQNSLTWNDRAKLFFEKANDNLTFDQLHWAAYRASVMFSEWRNNYASLVA
jgi:hypothetical protein